MNPINSVSLGWKGLENVLNLLVRAINQRTIETGYGLTKEEGESGIIIALESGKTGSGDNPSTDQTPQPDLVTPDGEIAGWRRIQVMDGNCNRFTMWVWGGTPH